MLPPTSRRPRTARRRGTFAAASALTAAALALTPSAATAAPAAASSYLTDIRTGRHDTFDRVVLDFSGNVPAYGISSSSDPFTNCASGAEIPLPGDEFSEIQAASAAHDEAGNPTYTGPRVALTPGLAHVTGYAITCDFEGHLNVGVATQGTVSQIRTFPLGNPSRIVIDVYR